MNRVTTNGNAEKPPMTTDSKTSEAPKPVCTVCGDLMPAGEEMFKFHGYSGPCPKPPLPKPDEPESLYVVERLSADCKHWSPVEFGAFVSEQIENAETVRDQFIELHKGKRQFRIARYVRDDQ
jgi:hypothetical protein